MTDLASALTAAAEAIDTALRAAFDESLHPRGERGMFTAKEIADAVEALPTEASSGTVPVAPGATVDAVLTSLRGGIPEFSYNAKIGQPAFHAGTITRPGTTGGYQHGMPITWEAQQPIGQRDLGAGLRDVYAPTIIEEIKHEFAAFPEKQAHSPVYLFRAVSERDWQRIQQSGFVDTDLRGGIESNSDSGSRMNADFEPVTSYLPYKGSSYDDGTGEGRIIRIDYHPDDGWYVEPTADGYARTDQRIPLDRVSMVSPVIVGDEHTHRTIQAAFDESLHPRDRGRFTFKDDSRTPLPWADRPLEGRLRQLSPLRQFDRRDRYRSDEEVRVRLQAAFPNANVDGEWNGWRNHVRDEKEWLDAEGLDPESPEYQEELAAIEATADRIVGLYDGLEQVAGQFPDIAARVTSLEMVGPQTEGGGDGETFFSPDGIRMQFSMTALLRTDSPSQFTIPSKEAAAENDMSRWSFGIALHEFGHIVDHYAATVEHGSEFDAGDYINSKFNQSNAPTMLAAWEKDYPDHFAVGATNVSAYAMAEPAEYAAEVFAQSRLDPSGLDPDARDVVEWLEQHAALRVGDKMPVAAATGPATDPDGTPGIRVVDMLHGDCVPVRWALRMTAPVTAAIGGMGEILREIPDKFIADTRTREPRRAYSPDQPRDYHGRFGHGDGGTAVLDRPPVDDAAARRQAAVERIIAVQPYLAEPNRLKIQGMDPDHAETLAWRIERFSAEHPEIRLAGITVGKVDGNNLGTMSHGGWMQLNGDPVYFGTVPPRPDPETATSYETKNWEYINARHDRFAAWTDNEGKASPSPGKTTFHPVDGAQATIDHELGHAVFERATQASGWSSWPFTRWALDMPHIDGWSLKAGEEYEKIPVRAVTKAMREMGSEYGSKSFTAADTLFGRSMGPAHDLNEGFADWYSMHAAGLPTEARTPPMIEAAFQRILEASHGGDVPRMRPIGGAQ